MTQKTESETLLESQAWHEGVNDAVQNKLFEPKYKPDSIGWIAYKSGYESIIGGDV